MPIGTLNIKQGQNIKYMPYAFTEYGIAMLSGVLRSESAISAYEGSTLAELREDFKAAVDSYIEGCLADGIEPRKPFSGKLIVRMSSDLHGRVAMAASSKGTTINDFITSTLAAAL